MHIIVYCTLHRYVA